MDILSSVILAIVEGLTEFLPVSSTGHMILAQGVLGLESSEYLKAFTVMIQFGAILSVLVYYWRRFIPWLPSSESNTTGRYNLSGWGLYGLMIIGCLPAAVLGLLLEDYIDSLLGSMWVVIAMLFIGGILMIILDSSFKANEEKRLSPRKALIVGFFQCLAMVPGVSRSMATIWRYATRINSQASSRIFFFSCYTNDVWSYIAQGLQIIQVWFRCLFR